MKNMIRFKWSVGGWYWFSPTREWLLIDDTNTKDFLTMLANVTRGYF
jgi:hypothetical protein